MRAQTSVRHRPFRSIALVGLTSLWLSGCESGLEMPGFLQSKDGTADAAPAAARTTELVERDVEAPDVFAVTEAGLWDGRPSLGGVWVAHPDVKDPERVIIRNPGNGKFVIGALFRRERETPGPRLQVSSDASTALGMVAGQPTNLNVTALRREEAPAEVADMGPAPIDNFEASPEITAQPLDNVASTAAAAIDAAAPAEIGASPTASAARSTTAAAKPAPARPASTLKKPYLQIGIFSIEQNAKNTAATMRQAGLLPTIIKGSSSGKTFWRVIVGPATSTSERSTLLKTIKAQGFTDAYAVTN